MTNDFFFQDDLKKVYQKFFSIKKGDENDKNTQTCIYKITTPYKCDNARTPDIFNIVFLRPTLLAPIAIATHPSSVSHAPPTQHPPAVPYASLFASPPYINVP